ncbi:MAG: PAS domain-containing protein [Candidatus Kariarchaeaceae archaeon]|jgi:photoactive yellow protein
MLTECAWCRNTINVEDSPSSNGICTSCLVDVGGIEHTDVSSFPRSFIDALPLGAIVLANDDTIISYNLAESEITGMAPDTVEGKNFFVDVAPCTAVRAFQGVVEKMRNAGKDSQESIEFTFNHQRFKCYVSILFTYYAQADYTIINVKQLEGTAL